MIRNNQRFLTRMNMIWDALMVFAALPLAFWLRFTLFPGVITVPLRNYVLAALLLAPVHVLLYAFGGLYESVRRERLYQELGRVLWANTLGFLLFLVFLFCFREVHFSRIALLIDFALVNMLVGGKRILVKKVLYRLRQQGKNQKKVILVGGGDLAGRYVTKLRQAPELGFALVGYVSGRERELDVPYLGDLTRLPQLLETEKPEEVVVAMEMEEYHSLPAVIHACEKSGVRLALLPFYVDFLPAQPQVDLLNGLPLINLRRIPLDDLGNAFLKRAMDIVGSLVLLILTSPIMLVTAVGVHLTSPGPILFRQKRVGRDKREFTMYKFRSMRLNDRSDTGWSTAVDDRRTAFGSFLRKWSIDELPQLWNVLRGDMSLVGPRPEVPYYVEQFKEEIPLYMVKHQVRPGMTGWAQVNGFRGDTSIEERIRHDIFYIENWTLLFDVKILLMTLFVGLKNKSESA